jgi:protein phosphatase
MLTDEVIHQTVLAAATPQAACDALIDAANRAGGEDNITVILVTAVPAGRAAG